MFNDCHLFAQMAVLDLVIIRFGTSCCHSLRNVLLATALQPSGRASLYNRHIDDFVTLEGKTFTSQWFNAAARPSKTLALASTQFRRNKPPFQYPGKTGCNIQMQ